VPATVRSCQAIHALRFSVSAMRDKCGRVWRLLRARIEESKIKLNDSYAYREIRIKPSFDHGSNTVLCSHCLLPDAELYIVFRMSFIVCQYPLCCNEDGSETSLLDMLSSPTNTTAPYRVRTCLQGA